MAMQRCMLESWSQGDLVRVEELSTEEISHPSNGSHHAYALAFRALVRSRLKQYKLAIDDAKMSVNIQRSPIGCVALALAQLGNGEYESAMHTFDLVINDRLSTEKYLLLIIKTITLFECNKHDSAVSWIKELIDTMDNSSIYLVVHARFFLLSRNTSQSGRDHKRSVALLGRALEAIPFQKDDRLMVISLIFGWDLDDLALSIQQYFREQIQPLEDLGDVAMQSNDPFKAIEHYSDTLSFNPPNRAALLVKRSEARGILELWDDALRDADEAVKTDSQSPWGYERLYLALHALKRYSDAVDAIARMYSLLERSNDHGARSKLKHVTKAKETSQLNYTELAEKYASPTRFSVAINDAVIGISNTCPLVLIDVRSGRLCDGPERVDTFKSDQQFKRLVSFLVREQNEDQIFQVVKKYFEYVTFSHVWEGKEPSYQDVRSFGSIWDLDGSPLNNKLRKFCDVVREDGYRWAWSDTCCIDKTIGAVLNRSLKMMYKWYESSAATFVFLADVDSVLNTRLKDSKWMTRAWTSQELLVPIVIRFYDRNWKPYLGDTRHNHKESPEIMQELVDAIGITRETIRAFNPESLAVREKLRLASTRNATVEEDVAYSLIGIFQSDIRPGYGEQYAALGHLLEEIVARTGEVTVLAWSGKSSLYNSCLPATLAAYSQKTSTTSVIGSVEMHQRVTAVKRSFSQDDVTNIYDQVTRLPPARFANRRLHLPCIIFGVKRLEVQDTGGSIDGEIQYRARVSGLGHVAFWTSDRLSLTEPRKLVFVHPWIRDLRDPLDGYGGVNESDDESDPDYSGSSAESEYVSAPDSPTHAAAMGGHTGAFRLVVRLQQPFHALLLQQQPDGEFRRVAAEHEIVVQGLDRRVNFMRDVRTDVLEIR